MYEDTPHELVHDLMSEAVFGDHPLGRPVIGTADVISSVGRRALTSYHQTMYRAGNVVVAAAGNLRHDDLVASLDEAPEQAGQGAGQRPARATAARAPASPERPLSAQAHRAVPRLPRGPGNRALRPPPLHGFGPRRAARRLGLVAALPGDPREAGHGLLRLHVRLPVHGHGPDRLLRRHPLGEPRRLPGDRERADRRGRGGEVPQGRARAGEGEPQGTDPALDGVHVEPDEPPREVADLRHGAPLHRPDRRRDRRGHARCGGRALPACCSLPRSSPPPGSGRARSGSATRCAGSSPSWRRARRREAQALRSTAARSGPFLGPALEAAGHELVDGLGGAEAMVDFTAPDAVLANIEAAWRQACRASSGRPAGTGPGGPERPRSTRLPSSGSELRGRRGADDPLRGRGGGTCRGRRSSSCTTRRRSTRPRAQRRRRPRLWAAPDPLRAPSGPGGPPGGAALTDRELLTIRHDAFSREAYARACYSRSNARALRQA